MAGHDLHPKARQYLTGQLFFFLFVAIIILIVRSALGAQRILYLNSLVTGVDPPNFDSYTKDVISNAEWSSFNSPHRPAHVDLRTELIVVNVLEGLLWGWGVSVFARLYVDLRSKFTIEALAFWAVATAWYVALFVEGFFSGLLNIIVGVLMAIHAAIGLGVFLWRYRQAGQGIAPRTPATPAWEANAMKQSRHQDNVEA